MVFCDPCTQKYRIKTFNVELWFHNNFIFRKKLISNIKRGLVGVYGCIRNALNEFPGAVKRDPFIFVRCIIIILFTKNID